MRRRIASCFVAVDTATDVVAGYYTLSATGVPLADFPADIQKRLPRYPTVPAALVGRLAVDLNYRGRGLGQTLMIDALRRAADTMAFALVVDAKDSAAAAFYGHFGFIPFGGKRLAFPLERFKTQP